MFQKLTVKAKISCPKQDPVTKDVEIFSKGDVSIFSILDYIRANHPGCTIEILDVIAI